MCCRGFYRPNTCVCIHYPWNLYHNLMWFWSFCCVHAHTHTSFWIALKISHRMQISFGFSCNLIARVYSFSTTNEILFIWLMRYFMLSSSHPFVVFFFFFRLSYLGLNISNTFKSHYRSEHSYEANLFTWSCVMSHEHFIKIEKKNSPNKHRTVFFSANR